MNGTSFIVAFGSSDHTLRMNDHEHGSRRCLFKPRSGVRMFFFKITFPSFSPLFGEKKLGGKFILVRDGESDSFPDIWHHF